MRVKTDEERMSQETAEAEKILLAKCAVEGMDMEKIAKQIEKELGRGVSEVEVCGGDTGIVTFKNINDIGYWAKVTPTGRLKKNSIRKNLF